MDTEEPEDDGPEAPPTPPKPELKIRDLGFRPSGCSVCGAPKPPHIEIEVDGVLEYTCKECYEGQVVELAACRSCGAALEAADAVCGEGGTGRPVRGFLRLPGGGVRPRAGGGAGVRLEAQGRPRQRAGVEAVPEEVDDV